jgi:hypothetical protein
MSTTANDRCPVVQGLVFQTYFKAQDGPHAQRVATSGAQPARRQLLGKNTKASYIHGDPCYIAGATSTQKVETTDQKRKYTNCQAHALNARKHGLGDKVVRHQMAVKSNESLHKARERGQTDIDLTTFKVRTSATPTKLAACMCTCCCDTG